MSDKRTLTMIETNQPNNLTLRTAGLLYLGVVVTGIFSLMYVPKTLINWDNAAITTANIINNETLFRLGIASGILCYLFFLLLPLVLYTLLKHIHEHHAKLMVILAFISVPLFFMNIQNELTILSLISQGNSEQLQAEVLFNLQQYDNGMFIIHLFSGLWLLPFGYLVYKSGFLPKLLGIFLMLGCFGYLINFTGNLLIKNYHEMGVARYVSLPASIGEIGICLWLLFIKKMPSLLIQQQ
jgi:hypothetical protein